MPVLIIHGVDPKIPKTELVSLIGALQGAIASIGPLDLRQNQTTVWFPPDLVDDGLGDEIIIFVKGLYQRPERTSEVFDRLKLAIIEEVRKSFPQVLLVEVFIEPINENLCLSWDPGK